MAILSTVRSNVASMLRGRTDLNSEITQEIQNAIRHYSRRASWVIERRGGTITTVAGQHWYSTIDNTAGHGVENSPSGTTPTSADDLRDLIEIIYAKVELGNLDWPLDRVSYRTFETLEEGTSTSTTPRYITHFAGQIGFWPAPANSNDTLYVSGFYKPSIPSADSDDSVWFQQYQELIENSAARRMCQKWTHDTELLQMFLSAEREQELLLSAESCTRTTTGRLTPTVY